MCGIPCAVRLISARAASALAGISRASASATKAPQPLMPWEASANGPSGAQLEVLRPVRVGPVEHRLDRVVRRPGVEVVHRHGHISRGLRDRPDAELRLERLQELRRARTGVLDPEDDYRWHAVLLSRR